MKKTKAEEGEEREQIFTTTLGNGTKCVITRTIVSLPPAPPLDPEDLPDDPMKAGVALLNRATTTMRAPSGPRVSWRISVARPKVGSSGTSEQVIELAHAEAEELFSIIGVLRSLGGAGPWLPGSL
jgi:hypothetical protein